MLSLTRAFPFVRPRHVAVFLAFATHYPVFAQTEGEVIIYAVDPSGRTIDCGMTSFVGTTSKKDLSANFHGLRGTHIPYGSYIFTLWQKTLPLPGPPIVGRVDVQLPETLFVAMGTRSVPASGDMAPPQDFVISGRIVAVRDQSSQNESSEPLRIRLSPLLWNGPNLDVIVNSQGDFHVYKALAGPFLLSVIRGPQLLQVKEVDFDQGNSRPQPILINLSASPPAILHVR